MSGTQAASQAMSQATTTHAAVERLAQGSRISNPAESQDAQHAQHAPRSTLHHGHSRHELGSSISFSSLWQLHDTALREFSSTYIGCSAGRLVFSCRLDNTPNCTIGKSSSSGKRRRSEQSQTGCSDNCLGFPETTAAPAAAQGSFFKRARQTAGSMVSAVGLCAEAPCAVNCESDEPDDACFAVDSHLERLHGKVSDDDLLRVREVLVRMQRDLRGAVGESAVQAVGTAYRKLRPTDHSPRIVVMARINGGVAVPVKKLRAYLGPCDQDGVLTSLVTTFGIEESDLAALDRTQSLGLPGTDPMLIVTSLNPDAADATSLT